MADVAKTYGVGDTVFVAYPFPSNNYFTPQSRVISQVDIIDGTNEANVKFSNGEDVVDGAVVTIFDTQALCATGIIDDIIAKADVTVNLDATTTVASASGQTTLSLGRVDA